MVQLVKNLSAIGKESSLGREDTLENGMATHSSMFAWRIPWTEESGRHGVTNSWTGLSN